MPGMSRYAAQKTLEWSVGKTAMPSLPSGHLALFTTLPADDGTGGVEVTGGSYARVSFAGAAWGAASSTDPVTITNSGSASLQCAYIAGGVSATGPTRTCAFTPGVTYRVGVAWEVGRLAMCIDGGEIEARTANISAFAAVARIAVGCAPWSSSSAGTVSNATHRAFLYAPVTASDALLQQLTAP